MAPLPKLPAPRARDDAPDIDIWHVMNKADDRLISEEVLYGSMSSAFVYSFPLDGKETTGVSVVGARHLARKYGGLKHRLVASVEKIGSLFKSISYPADGAPMHVSANFVDELAGEEDYYQVLIEVTDIKTGNSVQAEKTELRQGTRRDKVTKFDRPNYATIAQSKAYRNAVLSLVPQDVIHAFKQAALKAGNSVAITSPIDEAREKVLRFATAKAIPLRRAAVFDLGMTEIAGLRDAVEAGGKDDFVKAARAVGALHDPETGEVTEPVQVEDKRAPAAPVDQGGEPATVDAKPAAAAPVDKPKLFGAEG